MHQEALFNSGVFRSVYDNWLNYLTADNMYVYAAVAVAFLFLAWLPFKFAAVNDYRPFMPAEKLFFDRSRISDWSGAVLLAFSFAAYVTVMFCQEMSVFNNFDMMTIDFITSLKQGVKPVFGEWRFTPLSGFDYNFLFAVTNNGCVIAVYIMLKQLLCLFLLYKAFAFVPAAKRLVMLALVNFIPSVFWMNNVIFQEQNILIFVLLSLLALNKYQQTSKPRFLLWFVLAMNVALYIKETTVLFYAGLGAWLVLNAVFCEKITFWSFRHPLKTIKTLPVEWLMFWSMFVYSTYLKLAEPIFDNRYLYSHARSLAETAIVYKTELALAAAALLIMAVKFVRCRFSAMNLFGEGGVLGCAFIVVYVVFRLHIVPASDYLLSYYLYLPAVFCTLYIFSDLSNKVLWGLAAAGILTWSAKVNYDVWQAQQGKDRRQMAEFIIAGAKDNNMSIFIRSKELIDFQWWKTTGWISALKYAAPDSKLKFKTDIPLYRFYLPASDKYFETVAGQPEGGDYVLVNVKDEPDYVPDKSEVVCENASYRLYHIDD